MTAGRFVFIVLRSAMGGLILATPLSGDQLISAEIFLAVTGAVLVISLMLYLINLAQLEPAQIAVAWKWGGKDQLVDTRPSELRAIEGLLLSAQHNPRSHRNRLRPRTTRLAEHFLPINHGIDPTQDPARAQALFGELAWLVDPDPGPDTVDRVPTAEEIDEFLSIVLAEAD